MKPYPFTPHERIEMARTTLETVERRFGHAGDGIGARFVRQARMELAQALEELAPHHSPAEHARAASRIAADIGGAE